VSAGVKIRFIKATRNGYSLSSALALPVYPMGRPTSDGTGFPDGNRRFRHAAYIFGKDDGIRHLIGPVDHAHEVTTAEFVLGNGGTDRESARGSHGVKPFAQPITVLRQAGRLLRPNPSANLVSRNRRGDLSVLLSFRKKATFAHHPDSRQQRRKRACRMPWLSWSFWSLQPYPPDTFCGPTVPFKPKNNAVKR